LQAAQKDSEAKRHRRDRVRANVIANSGTNTILARRLECNEASGSFSQLLESEFLCI
jgi:hypothetical protein